MTVLTGPHFITTTPTLTTCARCERRVLAATVGGLDRHIDATALEPTGELTALLAGRPTFQLRRRLLTRRTVEHIRGGRSALVLAAHHCSSTGPVQLEVLAEAGLLPLAPLPDRCPF